jgi:hypothetical protein
VAAVDHLEEGDLGIPREIDVLSAIGNKLHKAPSCHGVITMPEKKNFWKVTFSENLEPLKNSQMAGLPGEMF